MPGQPQQGTPQCRYLVTRLFLRAAEPRAQCRSSGTPQLGPPGPPSPRIGSYALMVWLRRGPIPVQAPGPGLAGRISPSHCRLGTSNWNFKCFVGGCVTVKSSNHRGPAGLRLSQVCPGRSPIFTTVYRASNARRVNKVGMEAWPRCGSRGPASSLYPVVPGRPGPSGPRLLNFGTWKLFPDLGSPEAAWRGRDRISHLVRPLLLSPGPGKISCSP
eukprot:370946-Hanusia_phi.AAC.1